MTKIVPSQSIRLSFCPRDEVPIDMGSRSKKKMMTSAAPPRQTLSQKSQRQVTLSTNAPPWKQKEEEGFVSYREMRSIVLTSFTYR